MKKILLNSLIAVIVISAFAIVYSSSKATTHKNSNLYSTTAALPDSLMHIFKKACMDCHSDGGSGMAPKILNFSKWGEYSPDKQNQKATKICNVLTDDRMPPSSWKKSNANSLPTKKEVNDICKWSATLNAEK
jgi:hypothetical protein